ncbi:MAG: hypothetical protein LH629_03920 [Ignavibacteria bacterium]|nr:hypothetical protein [Ignavibacteria bacterium]
MQTPVGIFYNLSEEVQVLLNKDSYADFYKVDFPLYGDSHNFPSGVYYYKLTIKNGNNTEVFNETKAMVLLK